MHIYDPIGHGVLLCLSTRLERFSGLACLLLSKGGKADLLCVGKVPALVLVVVVRVQSLLAQEAEVVGGDVRLRAIVWDHIPLGQ